MYRGTRITLTGNTDLSAKRGYIVKIGTVDNSVALATAATERYIGILTDAVADGSSTACGQAVQIDGVAEVVYGGSVTRGDKLTSNGSGQAITTAVAGNSVIGTALESGASGEIHQVHITPGSLVPA